MNMCLLMLPTYIHILFFKDDGTIEYRNILMVQPHPRLVTGRGKSHEISCKPPKPRVSISGARSPHAARLTDYKAGDQFEWVLLKSFPWNIFMSILMLLFFIVYRHWIQVHYHLVQWRFTKEIRSKKRFLIIDFVNDLSNTSYFHIEFQVATNVKIGDPLTLEIALDKELGKHGLRVTDCIVKDGLGWAQQNLINNGG